MADVAQTKYKFSDSYSGVPTGIFNGAAGGYHFGGGWDAETDRRASKRAEGLQLFKDYVQTLTDNGIVPNQNSLNKFLGQASGFGLDASYGFDPYAAQQMMESAIKQGEDKKRELAEKRIQNEATTNKSLQENYNLERQNFKNSIEAIESFREKNPDLPPERFNTLAQGLEDNWNRTEIDNIVKGSQGIINLNYVDEKLRASPNMTDQQKTVLRQSINGNRNKYAQEIVDSLGGTIAQNKSDEELRKIIIPKLDPTVQNDEDMITKVLGMVKGNNASTWSKLDYSNREAIGKSLPELLKVAAQIDEQRDLRQRAALQQREEEIKASKQQRDAYVKECDDIIAGRPNKKGKKPTQEEKDAALRQRVEYIYNVTPDARRELETAETQAEVDAIVRKHKLISLDEIERRTANQATYANPSRTRNPYTGSVERDYAAYMNLSIPILSSEIDKTAIAIQKDKANGLGYNDKLKRLANGISIALRDARQDFINGGAYDITPQAWTQMELTSLSKLFTSTRLPAEDVKQLVGMIFDDIGEPIAVQKKQDGFEFINSNLKNWTTQGQSPLVHDSTYYGQDTARPTQKSSPESIKASWDAFTGNFKSTPVSIEKPAAPSAKTYSDINREKREERNRRFNNPQPRNDDNTFATEVTAEEVNGYRNNPKEYFDSMSYDDPRLDRAALYYSIKYNVPPGWINAIKNAGERSNNWQRPDYKKTGSTAAGVLQFTQSTINSKDLDLKHNPFNSIETIEAGAKLFAYEADRFRKMIKPAFSNADPYVAALIEYRTGSEAAEKYIKSNGFLGNLPKDIYDYVNRVVKYVGESSAERQLYAQVKMNSAWDFQTAMNETFSPEEFVE